MVIGLLFEMHSLSTDLLWLFLIQVEIAAAKEKLQICASGGAMMCLFRLIMLIEMLSHFTVVPDRNAIITRFTS